jgi:hypothetical protein
MRHVESELDALEATYGEQWGEAGALEAGEGEQAFDEVQEMELASALLEVAGEEELDRFLRDLIRRAGRTVGRAVRSPIGQQLGGLLRGAARKALPALGTAVGTAIRGPAGGAAGGRAATAIGQMFGLELEGLSPEDQEYEVARRFVRFAGSAANAARTPASAPPATAAMKATAAAARRHAPGLLSGRPGRPVDPMGGSGHGQWVRRGRNIIIVNCGSPAAPGTS